MTKQDFELIAKVLGRMHPHDDSNAFEAELSLWVAIRQEFIEELSIRNSRFNRRKFEDATKGRN